MIHWFKALDLVLKGEATRPDALRDGAIAVPILRLGAVTLLLGAVYGACMGAFALTARWSTDTRIEGYYQMLASAGKVPLLFLLTLLITFPSLYVFNALVGSRLSAGSVLRLTVAAVAVLMAVLASFGTIVVFFSLCTTSYPFMVLLNVATFSVAGLLGMMFLLRTLNRLSIARAMQWETVPPTAPDPEAPPVIPQRGALEHPSGQSLAPGVGLIFRIWVLLFAVVGSQMGWVLRPFIGNPHDPFTLFRERDNSNVFEAVTVKIKEATGNWPTTRHRTNPARGNQLKSPPATQPKP
jgi:hypothetical protein